MPEQGCFHNLEGIRAATKAKTTANIMESVASYTSPANDRGDLSSRLVPNSVRTSAAISGRFIAAGRRKVMVVRVDELPAEETRDEPQLAPQRWESERGWKRPTAPKSVVNYERVLRDANGSTRHSQEGQPYLELSRRDHVRHHWHQQPLTDHHWYHAERGQPSANHAHYMTSERPHHHATGGMVPVSSTEDEVIARQQRTSSYGSVGGRSTYTSAMHSSRPSHIYQSSNGPATSSSDVGRPRSNFHHQGMQSSVVIIPKNIQIPKEIVPPSKSSTRMLRTEFEASSSPTEYGPVGKRSNSSSEGTNSPQVKRAKTSSGPDTARLEGKFDKLDLLCSATLELGPLQDNPTGCSCPKSKCIALYCDCFKAGRRCDPHTCTCLNCKNTVAESGPNGARSKAIQSILARNPRAFTSGGSNATTNKLPPGEACNCIRSRCLKLYCTCFQVGKICNPNACTCVGCLNTHETGGHRKAAIEATLEKRPDAFDKPKVKEVGSGCACKNNRCIRKYCECFRTNLACTRKCSCRDCENQESSSPVPMETEPLDSSSTRATTTSK